jgi:hypothetical protein
VWRNHSETLAFLLAQGADVRQLDEVRPSLWPSMAIVRPATYSMS